jgi:alpha,alpha-trehalose phosphorylase
MSIPYDRITGINPQDAHFLDREVWDLKNTPPEKRPLMLHYHPLVIYPVPGAEAGRCGVGAVPPR